MNFRTLQEYGSLDNSLLVVENGRMAGDWRALRAAVPDVPGNYIWTIRPPGGRHWVPVYCGMAGNECCGTLRRRFKDYINKHTFGPKAEPRKYWPMLDTMYRKFSIRIW